MAHGHFGMAEHFVIDCVTFSRGVDYDAFLRFVGNGYHGYSFVVLGIEWLACTLNGLHTIGGEEFHEFLINQFHPLTHGCRVFDVSACLKSALEVVNNREKSFEHVFGSVLDYIGLFFHRTLAEVVELGHEEEIFFLLFLDLGLGLLELLVERVDVSELSVDYIVFFFFGGILLVESFLHIVDNFTSLFRAYIFLLFVRSLILILIVIVAHN